MAYFPTRQTTYTTSGAKGSFNLDPMLRPFTVTIGVILGNGTTATFNVETSLDDPFTVSDANANWTAEVEGSTSNTRVNLTSPVQRVRLNLTALGGSESVLFQIVQGV